VDARSGKLERTIRLPLDPYQFAVGFGSLWVTGYATDRRYTSLLRIDPRSGRVIAIIRGPAVLGSKLAATADAVWIGGADIFPKGHSERAGVRFLYKVDPRRNVVVRRVKLPGAATVVALVGQGRTVWATGWWGVAQVSASGRILFHQSFAGSGWSMALTPGAVWVAEPWFGTRPVRKQNRPARRLLRIATSGPLRTTVIDLPTQPGAVSAAAGVVWVTAGGIARIDAADTSPIVHSMPIDITPNYHVAFPGGVWISELDESRLSQVC
jgi:hypothetical protein